MQIIKKQKPILGTIGDGSGSVTPVIVSNTGEVLTSSPKQEEIMGDINDNVKVSNLHLEEGSDEFFTPEDTL